MRAQFFTIAAGAAALALAPAAVHPAAAQDIRWESESKLELGGAFGRVMRFMPGIGDAVKQTTSIKGDFLRTDADRESSTIMRADDGRIIHLDHENRTYWVWDLSQMMTALRNSRAQAEAAMAEAEAERPREQPDTVHFEVTASIDRSGKRERVAGFQAEQVFVTINITGEAYDEEGDSIVRGTLVVLNELWLSTEFPGAEAEQDFYRRWAERYQQSPEMQEEMAGLSHVFQQDPRIKEGVEQMAEQMKELQGTPLRSIAHFVALPDGVPFDREAVLKDANKSLASDVGSAAARGAAESARRRVGGLLGRRGGDEEARPEQPRQAVIMRIKDEVKKVERRALGADLFEVPSGYTERNPFEQR